MRRHRPMGIMKQPMALVPHEYRREINRLSKAALADMAWDLAGQCVDCAEDDELVIAKFRENWEIVKLHRDQA